MKVIQEEDNTMKARYYVQMIGQLTDTAARDRDRRGDQDGLWQALIDALAKAYDRAHDLLPPE